MPCSDKNPLAREGTSTLNRVLAALSTGFAKVDERDAADILLFAKRYASYLNYYNSANTVEDNWQALMKMDVSVVLATIDKIDLRKISDYKKLLYKRITIAANDAEAKKQFKFLFDLLFSLISLIDEQYKLIPDEFEFKKIIGDIIQKKLQVPAMNLIKCFKDFKAVPLPLGPLLSYSVQQLDGEAPFIVRSDNEFDQMKLSDEWHAVPADINLTLPALPDSGSLIIYIINHNLFNAQVELLLNGIAGFVKYASTLFNQTIENFPKHAPHYGLFLSFIKLFRYAQDHLNTYTQRHLDFYYKDVLQLKNKDPEPDSAHLNFELQKPVDQEILRKGTLFKGGKDTTGKEISYALSDDLVINKAAISKMQSWQKIQKEGKEVLIASPVADSDDGMGAKITSADKSWFTFGDVKKAGTANVGFAIASNLFFLNEGEREIDIVVTFVNDISDIKNTGYDLHCFSAALTGKKEWHHITSFPASFPSANQIRFTIGLSPDDPAIIPYSEKLHKENLEIDLPLLKINLNQDIKNPIPFSTLCNRQILSLQITVKANNLKDLMLSHDNGTVDASKPFKPFGDFPDTGASFYIGSKEIFQKQLTEITLNTRWKDSGTISPVKGKKQIISQKMTNLIMASKWKNRGPTLSTTVNYLRQSNWNDSFSLDNHTISFASPRRFSKSVMDFGPNEILKATTPEGFLRIQLNDAQYSLKTHLSNISDALSKTTIAQDPASGTQKFNLTIQPVPVPAEILLESFSVSYVAAETLSFSPTDNRKNNLFFHFTPFGYYEVTPALFPDGISTSEAAEKLTVLPNVAARGEFFLGLENAAADRVVTVLFQVADGSSNPLQKMEKLDWYYLAGNNNWKKFDNSLIIDNTKNFTQSGIIIFTFPADICNQNTALQKGLHWLKSSVLQNTDAVCKMILVKAQAGRVQLVQDEFSQIEFRQTAPSGTISKLMESDGAIKTIVQPSDSFDGRTRESDEHFYIRVSERLRHKQRAVSIWDYEHIVLEKFQKIYKVKCLNHTGFYYNDTSEIFCENFPGHVTIVPIPDLKNKTNINPLRPYTPIGLLTNIEDYLKTITSPFVKLHVRNPKFEEIRLSFKVKFTDHLDVSAYHQILNLDIEKYLSPWAYQDGAEISFNGKIIKSVLLNFVEERSYVDYVTCFRMDHIIERDGTVIKKANVDVEAAQASTSRSVLVSYLNEEATGQTEKRHLIDTEITCVC